MGESNLANTSLTKGTHSQLIASAALLANGYLISEPLAPDTMDFVIKKKEEPGWKTVQVKSIYYRTDKNKDYYVVYSRKGDKTCYTPAEVDVIVGVYGDEIYLIDNIGNQEYWSQPHQAPLKWTKLSPYLN